MARIALDADLLIAFLDPADAQHARAIPLLQKHLSAGNDLLISASVYAEILVRPLQQRIDDIVDRFIAAAGISIIPIDRDLARATAQLRAAHASLRLPDAMCLAAASQAGAVLLTSDERLTKVQEFIPLKSSASVTEPRGWRQPDGKRSPVATLEDVSRATPLAAAERASGLSVSRNR